jgi:membrane protein implicated in regulation of membrane protease activity
MSHPAVIPVIAILILIIVLVITGYIYDPIVSLPSLALIGFLSYRIVYVILKTRHRDIYSYVGKIGQVKEDIIPGKVGYVLLEGELWEAISDEVIHKGETVTVIERQGLKLKVKRADTFEGNKTRQAN